MASGNAKTPSLRDIRGQKPAKTGWLRRNCSWLFRWDSVFYYGVFLFVLGALWAAYPLFTNSFTQLLNWDYTWQYISFTYDYWDAWHLFFTTGKFPLYDGGVYLGTDMIGSGSYYGLFDPFMFICYLFPRAWIPQMYAQMTFAKLMFGGLAMRHYLKIMGIKEWTARIGGIIYAFSGFTTFFEGAPNFTSAMAFFPLILAGLEKVIREQKVTELVLGVFLLGISCFFYMPILCIFGVIYALWRFFFTVKQRDRKTNGVVMALGVTGFAIGILLSSFSLLPSLRETSLSGRTSSIGRAYLHSMVAAFKSADIRMLFTLVFEEVGDNPGRELMGIISFFFPTGGWTQLPIARGTGYDAWTASLFCYTPCVILFFCAVMNSIRLKKWSHLVAVLLCVFAVFTNFSYFFFFVFTGNGYGRWYLILIPLIVYYCCWSFDLRKEEPRFIPLAGSVFALIGTVVTFYLTEHLLKGKVFGSFTYNIHNTTYWVSEYRTATEEYNGVLAAWYFYYQLAFVAIEGTLFAIGHRKEWTKYALFGLVAVEAVVMGNLSYAFNGVWSYKYSYAGGEENRNSSLVMANAIEGHDKSFFRTHSDTFEGSNYYHNVAGLNTPSSFHSLMNFDLETFAINNQMKLPGSSITTYNEEHAYNPRWSGYYGNKRYVTDSLLGMRYYIVTNNYSAWKDAQGNPMFLPANVPFGTKELTEYSPNRDRYRVYRRDESSLPQLGYAIDSNLLYRMGEIENSIYKNAFYLGNEDTSGQGFYRNLEWTQYVERNGAIIEDKETIAGFNVETAPMITNDASLASHTGIERLSVGAGLTVNYYETVEGDGLFPSSAKDYKNEGLGYFLNHYDKKTNPGSTNIRMLMDQGKMAFSSSRGVYLNDDPNGCYFELRFYNGRTAEQRTAAPRIYALGDRYDANGNILEENVCLGFDNVLLENASRTDYYVYRACTFGLYARGRVKQIVLCFGGSGSVTVNAGNFYLAVKEKHEIDAEEARLNADALQNVKTDTNAFTFDTSYDKDRIVVTQLGYDKGWEVNATLPGGIKKSCQMLKLDGGLVGFVAPSFLGEDGVAQAVHYEMRYVTPYLKLAAAGWVIGVVCYFGILTLQFVAVYRRKKKATELVA